MAKNIDDLRVCIAQITITFSQFERKAYHLILPTRNSKLKQPPATRKSLYLLRKI